MRYSPGRGPCNMIRNYFPTSRGIYVFLSPAILKNPWRNWCLEHARKVGGPSLQRFVESNTKRFTNANAERIAQLLGSFDPNWSSSIESFLIEEYKAAVDSVVGLRNSFAHGASVGNTYAGMLDYYKPIKTVVEEVKVRLKSLLYRVWLTPQSSPNPRTSFGAREPSTA